MIRLFLKYYKPYKKLLLFVIFGTFISSLLNLIFPLVVRNLIHDVLPARNLSLLFQGTGILLALYILNFIIQYQVQYRGHKMSAYMENDMRNSLFRHLETLSFRFFDNEKTGQLLSRVTSDITEISDLSFRGPNDLLICAVIMAGTLIIMLMMNWRLAAVIDILLILKAIHTVFINRKMKSAFRKNRVKSGEISATTEESLSGIHLVKAFAQEAFENKRFEKKGEELRDTKLHSYKLIAYFSSSINFFTDFINVTVLFLGGCMIYMNTLRISDFVAFLLYVNIFMRPVFRLTILAEVFQRGMAGFYRFHEIMEVEPDVRDPEHPLAMDHVKGRISFDHVTFGYERDQVILRNLSFTIEPGETVAFVGETGAGKSTIASLILRFYDPQEGSVCVDGHSVKEYNQQELRRHIGFVQQDVFLFGDSIADNIRYGNESATDEEVRRAARLAAADDFIRALPHGYDTKVGERGVKLSGGQKQRIAIARVFLKNPPMVIFDEATSALDTVTETKIQETLQKLAYDRTTMIIAHRLSTVEMADRIFVLHHGQIAETGTHDSLMRQKGIYYALYEAQKKNQDASHS